MNNYPEWWSDTVTVYNRYDDPVTKKVSWTRHILTDCFWKYVHEKVKVNETIIQTNATVCRIPKREDFLDKYLWLNLLDTERENFFTLGIGDIVVKGEVDDDIDEYTSGKRSSDFTAKFKKLQGCLVVEEVSINVGGGRGDEHYRVSGV